MAENENNVQQTDNRGHKKVLSGKVVSDKMDKTVTVQVIRRFKHPVFKKYVSKRLSYKAHDERNECNAGDEVLICESRPVSKQKRWRVTKIVKKAI